LLRVRSLEARPPSEPALCGERLSGRDRLVVDVDASDGAARGGGDSERRSPGAARNVEQRPARPEIQPADEAVLLGGRDPALLPDVFAERVAANLGVERGAKVTVARVVVRLLSRRLAGCGQRPILTPGRGSLGRRML